LTRQLLADRRELAAAKLHRLDSWRARTAYVRDLAERVAGVQIEDTRSSLGWRLRLLGRTATSTTTADGACSNWAQAVMREFPELALP
jgi:hypothetical protein